MFSLLNTTRTDEIAGSNGNYRLNVVGKYRTALWSACPVPRCRPTGHVRGSSCPTSLAALRTIRTFFNAKFITLAHANVQISSSRLVGYTWLHLVLKDPVVSLCSLLYRAASKPPGAAPAATAPYQSLDQKRELRVSVPRLLKEHSQKLSFIIPAFIPLART